MARSILLRALSVAAASMVVVACAAAPKPTAKSASPAAAETESDEADGDESDGDGAEAESAAPAAAEEAGPCPEGMALVADRVCVDKYEASLLESMPDGTEQAFPNNLPVDGHVVRAVSVPGVLPQGFISEVQAADACAASNKRLCSHEEWKTACMGPSKTTFPYGDARRPGACHDTGKSAVIAVFGAKAVAASTPYAGAGVTATARTDKTQPKSGKDRRAHATTRRAAQTTEKRVAKRSGGTSTKVASSTPPAGASRERKTGALKTAAKAPLASRKNAAKASAKPASVDPGVWAKLNDPALGKVDGALAKTGDHGECVNGWGVYDMVGNIHEWVATNASLPNGTFAGGYYLDTSINGDGCNYRTVAHAHDYHDYSTGFRCCADPKPVELTAKTLPALPR